MALDRENILCDQAELKQLNQQLQTQVVASQNNATQADRDPSEEDP